MSFPVITSALLLSTAPVAPDGAPTATAVPIVELAAKDQGGDPGASPPAPVEEPSSAPPSTSKELVPATEPVSSTEQDSSVESADPGDAASELLNPAADEDETIVVIGRGSSPDDPLQELNAESYEVTQKVDQAIVAPIAFAYKDTVPRKLRTGVRNFLNNLSEPIVFLNFMLQLKPGKAAETLGRFSINTTLGVGGLVDIAKRKPFYLPYRNNGFANTLGYYGVKPGPYFYLPLIGSTTLRDFIGNRVDQIILPLALGRPFNRPEFAITAAVLNELDDRIEFDDELRQIRATRDPYVASREYYLRKRQAEIDALHGRGDGMVPVTVPAPAAPVPVEPPAPASPEPAAPPPTNLPEAPPAPPSQTP